MYPEDDFLLGVETEEEMEDWDLGEGDDVSDDDDDLDEEEL